jgi:hypothetical protein
MSQIEIYIFYFIYHKDYLNTAYRLHTCHARYPHANIPLDKKIYAYNFNLLYPIVMRDNLYLIDLNMNLKLFGFFYAEIVVPSNLTCPMLQLHYNTVSKKTVRMFCYYSKILK